MWELARGRLDNVRNGRLEDLDVFKQVYLAVLPPPKRNLIGTRRRLEKIQGGMRVEN